MAILKADILTFVNDALNENFQDGEIDSEIKTVLRKMSNKDLLVGSDTETINANDTTMVIPTGHRATFAITLTDTAGVAYEPLVKILHNEYRSLKQENSATGRPENYSEFNGTWFLWRPSNAEYEVLKEYYKDHPADPDNIEFGDEFEEILLSGTTFYKARNKNKQTYAFWKGEFEEALREAVQSFKRDAYIVP